MWTPAFGHRKRVQHYDNGEPHFLTFSCYRRMPLLNRDRTRKWFVEALLEARDKHGFHLWAWVVMPEHVHLLVWPPFDRVDPDSTRGRIAGLLSDLKRPLARKAIAYLADHAPDFLERLVVRNRNRTYCRFWQPGSGFDENVSDAGALHEVAAYVHANPVRRGLATRAEEWEWSSARDWAGIAQPVCDRTIPSRLEVPWTER